MTNQEFITELKKRRIYSKYVRNLKREKKRTILQYFPIDATGYNFNFRNRLYCSFIFDETPEGFRFWYNHANKLP